MTDLITTIRSNGRALPLFDSDSHADMYRAIKELIGTESESSINYMIDCWLKDARWSQLREPEYVFLTAILVPKHDFIGEFFRRCNFEGVFDKVLSLPETKAHPERQFELIELYGDMNVAAIFTHFDDVVKNKIAAIDADRARSWSQLLMDPHDPNFAKYLRYSPSNTECWKCTGISIVKPPRPGDAVIVDVDTAMARFTTFTCGRITDAFPHKNIIIAGGSITKLLAPEYDEVQSLQSDVDIFVFGASVEEKLTVFRQVVAQFDSPDTFYAINGSVLTIYIKDVARKFQVIVANHESAYDVLARFDVTHVQWGFHCGKFVGLPGAFRAARERLSRINMRATRVFAQRMIKVLYYGYDLETSNIIKTNYVDITGLIADPAAEPLQQIIREFYNWYYPMSSYLDKISAETARLHIISQIQKDSNSAKVVQSIADVEKYIYIGGNFDKHYEALSFVNFNQTIIDFKKAITNKSFTLRTMRGPIRLTTPTFILNSLQMDDGIIMEVNVDDVSFIAFIAQLENDVFRVINVDGVTRSMIADGRLTLTISRTFLDSLGANNKSIIHNQRGEPLDINECLSAGDQVQFKFSISVVNKREERHITLRVERIIKHMVLVVGESVKSIDIVGCASVGEKITYDQ